MKLTKLTTIVALVIVAPTAAQQVPRNLFEIFAEDGTGTGTGGETLSDGSSSFRDGRTPNFTITLSEDLENFFNGIELLDGATIDQFLENISALNNLNKLDNAITLFGILLVTIVLEIGIFAIVFCIFANHVLSKNEASSPV